MIALTGLLFRRDQSYNITNREVYFLSIMGFTGFAFVVLSQNQDMSLVSGELTSSRLAIGFAFLAVALVLAPLAAFGLRWGVDLGNGLSDAEDTQTEIGDLHLFGAIVANLIGNIITLPVVMSAGGLFARETLTLQFVILSVISGIISLSIANIAWRKANLVTHDLGINKLSYLTDVTQPSWSASEHGGWP